MRRGGPGAREAAARGEEGGEPGRRVRVAVRDAVLVLRRHGPVGDMAAGAGARVAAEGARARQAGGFLVEVGLAHVAWVACRGALVG